MRAKLCFAGRALSPAGTAEGFPSPRPPSPGGAAERGERFCRPSGADDVFGAGDPGLTPGANVFRASGAAATEALP